MPHSFHFFGSTLIGIYLAFHLYFLWWADRYFSPSRRSSRAFKFWLLAMALLFPAAEYFEGRAAGGLSDAFIWLGFFWLGAMFILVTVLLLCDLLFLAIRFFRPGWRRALGASALTLAAALIALAVFRGAALPEVRPVDIALRGLPAALDGFKIVQISDVHIGRIVTVGKFRRLAALVNASRPDLIVFTGDITERGVEDPEEVCSVIRSMNAVYGKAGVLGNHDSFAGPDNSAAFFEACGVKMLRFVKYEPVPGLQVAGVDSPRRGAPAVRTLDLLLSDLSPSRPLLFLSHRPDMPEQVLKGFQALALGGHTHEGQLYPFGLLERHLFKYFYGLYRVGGSSVYVTSGAGTWGPPMRLFTVSELPLFVLHPA